MNRKLIFGAIRGGAGETLVFIPAERAPELAAIHRAIESVSTWREFAEKIPKQDWEKLLEEFEPDLDASFDPCEIGICDGDWPEWPEQQMEEWLPVEVLREYGAWHDTRLNGQFLSFDPNRTSEILDALAQAGCACLRDDALVKQACGQGELDELCSQDDLE